MTDLPAGWRYAPLPEVAKIQGGIQKQAKRRPVQNKHPFLRVANVTAEGLDLQEIHDIELFDGEIDKYRLHRGDLLVVEGNGSANQIGRAAVWDGSIPDAVHQNHLIRVRPRAAIDPRYLGLVWNSPDIREYLSRVSSSTSGLHTLSVRKLQQVYIPFAPLDVQKRIVEVLEGHLSRLDAGTDYLDAARRRSERFRVALNRRFFARYAAFLQPLSSVVVIENGQTPRGLTDRLTDTLTGDVVPFFKVGDMNSGDGRSMAAARYFVRRADAGSLGLHMRSSGSVLIPKRGGAIATNKKRILTTEAAYDLNTMGLRPKEPLSVEYLWRWFQGVDLGRIADGSSVPQINAKQIKGLSIPMISREEQDRLVAELDDLDGSANRLLAAVASGQKRASSLRRALFAAAFAGRLTGAASEVEQIEEIAASAVETTAPESVLF
ncbi:restriction endonuclease subunit S [Streptomyces microflavus]|uniref:Restriction endonuclease subunit S n=1 Tax=Streptomyces microflavus TaxID=1919 RepID=A0ABV1Q450_STRMI